MGLILVAGIFAWHAQHLVAHVQDQPPLAQHAFKQDQTNSIILQQIHARLPVLQAIMPIQVTYASSAQHLAQPVKQRQQHALHVQQLALLYFYLTINV